MDDRLIFLYCAVRVINAVGTEKDKRAGYMSVQSRRRFGEANPSGDYAESLRGGFVKKPKALSPCFPENPRREFTVHSYRKPTQVG